MTQSWTAPKLPQYHGISTAPRVSESIVPVRAIVDVGRLANVKTNANGESINPDSRDTPVYLETHYHPASKSQWTSHSNCKGQGVSATYASASAYPHYTWDTSGFEDDYDEDSVEGQGQAARRFSGACRQCKKLKTKCEFIVEYNMCRRCKTKERICVFEGRKKTEHKHEILIAQLRDKEATIDALLKEFKDRGIVQEDQNGDNDADSDVSKDTPPNLEMQRWIKRLYERYPPDPNNDWTVPSTELQRWNGNEKDGRGAIKSAPGSSKIMSEAYTSGSDVVDTDDNSDEFEEGILPQLHPFLVHHVPSIPVPFGYIADFRQRMYPNKPTRTYDDESAYHDAEFEDQNDFGVAHPGYFHPGPSTDIDQRRFYVEREPVPDMLMHGLITLDDVDELFKIYFQRLNVFVSLLDPVLHTPPNTFSRCPFLFTVICAVTLRYYTPKRAIYKYAMHFAKILAGSYLVNGWKTVELCQAYILLSTFSMPPKKWEEDRSRLYLELAVRIALDLNLYQPFSPLNLSTEKYKRESLNRTRTWLNCYNLDCSMSTLLGRSPMLTPDIVSDDMVEWYTRSPYNHTYDVHLCAYTEALRLMCQFHDAVRGGVDGKRDLRFYKRVTTAFNDQLDDVHARIAERYDRDSDKNDSGCVFRTGLLPLIINYFRLVMFSFGFQEAVDQGLLQKGDMFFQNCFDAASNVITSMIDILAPMAYMRFSPDGYFVFTAFAAAFLLKLLRPDFAKILKRAHKDQISTLVRKLIRFLGSTEVAVDEWHTPKLYSRFLTELVARMFPVGRSKSVVNANGDSRRVEDNTTVETAEQLQEDADSAKQGVLETQSRSTSSELGEGSSHGPPHARYHGDVYPAQVAPPEQCTQPHLYNVVPQAQDQHLHTQSQTQPHSQPHTLYQDASIVNTDTWPSQTFTSTGIDAYITDEPMSLPALSTEEYILSMQAINNPRWWENVMMPGFSWPPVQSTTSTSSSVDAGTGQLEGGYGHYQQQVEVYEYEYEPPELTGPAEQGYSAHIVGSTTNGGSDPQQEILYGAASYQTDAYHGANHQHALQPQPQPQPAPQFENQFVGQTRSIFY